MFRFLKIFTSIAFVVALPCLNSCVEDQPDADVTERPGASSEMGTITATATTLNTKIYTLDGVNLLWENKDAVALRYQEHPASEPASCVYTTAMAAPKSKTTFKNTSGKTPNKVDGQFIAVYPASSAYVEWAKDAYVILAANAEQTVKNKYIDKNSVVMIASSEDSEFNFKHVVSYIKFTVNSTTSPFCKVTVKSGDKSQYMVSRIKVDFDEEFSYSLVTKDATDNINEQTKDYVSFSTADLNNLTEGTYLIAVNPDNYTKGFKVTFENSSGCVVTKDYSNSYKAVPGGVIDLGVVGNLGFEMSLPHIGVYKNGNTNLGVVFYQDPGDATKKKVVSATGVLSKWSTSNGKWRISSYKEDYDYVHTVVTTSEKYMNSPEDFPAVKFCEQMRKAYGGNWHVPSLSELNMLFNGYYGKQFDAEIANNQEYTDSKSKTAAQYFDSLLEFIGGNGMLSVTNEYWICGQNTAGNMQYVNMKRYNSSNDVQTVERYVRCVCDVDESIPEDKIIYPQTDIGKLIKGQLASKIIDVMWDTTYNVTNGLDYYQMKVKTDDPVDNTMDVYFLRTDLSKGLDLKVGISNKTTPLSLDQKVLTEIAAQMSTSSNPVYAMVNADFCDNVNLRPRGPLHVSGNVYWSTYSLDLERFPHQGVSYIGMTYDGKMVIGPRDNYPTIQSTLKECTGAGVILVQDSKIVGGGASKDPRTAIGYTSGNFVWLFAVDGRHKGTEGMNYSEMASIFFALDCQMAVNMDGGGSTEMIARNPKTGKIQICNRPSDPTDGDGGVERKRPTAWAVVKK